MVDWFGASDVDWLGFGKQVEEEEEDEEEEETETADKIEPAE